MGDALFLLSSRGNCLWTHNYESWIKLKASMLGWSLFNLQPPIVHNPFTVFIFKQLINQYFNLINLFGSVDSKYLFDFSPDKSAVAHLVCHSNQIAKLWHQKALVCVVSFTRQNKWLFLLGDIFRISFCEVIVIRHLKFVALMVEIESVFRVHFENYVFYLISLVVVFSYDLHPLKYFSNFFLII